MRLSQAFFYGSFLIVVISCLRATNHISAKTDEEKTPMEYVISYGYRFEEHKVETKDGYILTLWHIPCKLNEECGTRKPILLQHGIIDNGFSFLFQDLEKNLPMMLIKDGYDVWIGNSRGSYYSLEHKDMIEHDPMNYSGAYWDFTWDETAEYDFPAEISYVKKATGYKKISYLGHSQGTTYVFAYGSNHPEFVNENLDAVIIMAPAVYAYYHYSSGVDFLRIIKFAENWDATGYHNLFAMEAFRWASLYIAKYFPWLWSIGVDFIGGWRYGLNMDTKRLTVLAAHQPGGSSLHSYIHWVQAVYNDTFRYYDYGKEGNLKKYGQIEVPAYPIENVKKFNFKIFVIYGDHDSMASPRAVQKLYTILRPGYHETLIMDNANHLDVIWSDKLHDMVFPKIIDFLKRQSE